MQKVTPGPNKGFLQTASVLFQFINHIKNDYSSIYISVLLSVTDLPQPKYLSQIRQKHTNLLLQNQESLEFKQTAEQKKNTYFITGKEFTLVCHWWPCFILFIQVSMRTNTPINDKLFHIIFSFSFCYFHMLAGNWIFAIYNS